MEVFPGKQASVFPLADRGELILARPSQKVQAKSENTNSNVPQFLFVKNEDSSNLLLIIALTFVHYPFLSSKLIDLLNWTVELITNKTTHYSNTIWILRNKP